MPPDSDTPLLNDNLQSGKLPPSVSSAPPLLVADAPPPLPPQPAPKASAGRQVLAILLSLCLGLFLADAVVSLLDDSLIILFGSHLLTGTRGMVWLLAMLMALVIYGLMGLTPMIPKRLFLPLTLFNPVAALVIVPLFIYFYNRIQQAAWIISLGQVLFGLNILYLVQGGYKLRWPLVPEKILEARRFSWRNLSVFLLVNLVVLLPAVIAYLVLCAALAVSHFSEGFLAVRPGGLTVQVRKYTRSDGKTIQLCPMSHIADPDFYRKLAQSFPTNSIILMEGVTDNRNLLTNKITYKRMASSLGLAEQHEEFKPTRGEMVRADVDVEQFTTNTLGLLNLAMLVHSKGLNADTLLEVLHFSPPPHYEEELLNDLLRKRNRRLLEELQARLPQTEHIIVPWGVAHMPEIAAEIQKTGFQLVETQEYVVIGFGSASNRTEGARKAGHAREPQ
ncbi:MAG: hypothetical protein ACLQU3_13040 [Limisphaerales bacterium]